MNDSGRTCGCCGKQLDGIPTDMAYRRPVHYFLVPEGERAKRIYETDDFCIIDGSTFVIRGVLSVPIADQPGRSFTWGLWAAIARDDFERYLELYDSDAEGEAPFRGALAVSPPNYPDLLDAEVSIHFATAKSRPHFHPLSFDHRLFREHRDGISTQRWHQIIAELDEYQSGGRH
ncbi:MAG TPA: DUF2199 domain-containing protein [Myxococcales bacterium]|nr:DUF2199 domain-containing protein [Myxococcales bacterium]